MRSIGVEREEKAKDSMEGGLEEEELRTLEGLKEEWLSHSSSEISSSNRRFITSLIREGEEVSENWEEREEDDEEAPNRGKEGAKEGGIFGEGAEVESGVRA